METKTTSTTIDMKPAFEKIAQEAIRPLIERVAQLEAAVQRQQATIEQLAARVEKAEAGPTFT